MTALLHRTALPIDALIPQVLQHLRVSPNLVLRAEPGAGKTTRVPPALLEIVAGEVLVLEPRRIAARMSARRVAQEMGEPVGHTAGYQVRFEEAVSAATRLRFVTEGILVRRLLSDPQLRGVDAVVLDEFHERHLDSDLSLALLRQLQKSARPDLKLVVMSATLDAAPVAEFLGGCPVMHASGRAFPLAIEHAPYSPQPLHVQVRLALAQLLDEGHRGHTLVFLPGSAEIRRSMRECAPLAESAGLLMLPLHGDLSPMEQDRAVASSMQPKLILATNVAESSLTVEGVTAVIDSGLARVASHSPWTGLPTLQVQRISRASATQRAGRAGRTAPGTVLRLYPENDFRQRPEQDPPEIERADLSGLSLILRVFETSHNVASAAQNLLEWLTPPPAGALRQADDLLDLLGAQEEIAREMARLPLPPRFARVLLEARERGVYDDACTAAAILAAGARAERADLLEAMDAERAQPDPRGRQTEAQLRRTLRGGGSQANAHRGNDDRLLQSLLAGFPDRVAKRRAGRTVLLGNDTAAEMAEAPAAYEFMTVLDAQDRSDRPQPLVRMAARVEPDWLLDLFPEHVHEVDTLQWDRDAERVEAVSELRYRDLVLQEWHDAKPRGPGVAALLAQKAMEMGIAHFADLEALEDLQARAAFAGLPPFDLEATLAHLCEGISSFAELRRAAEHLLPALEHSETGNRLRELAPSSLRLKAGRTVRVHYEPGKPPWIASRMQDFFGMEDGPRIGPQRTPVVMQLLGPNHRPVQQTADLRGFWQRLYPEIRRELMRRYPRHPWPEKPV